MSSSPINREISESEIRTYESEGIVCLRGFFSEGWVVSMREAAEASMAYPGELHAELAEQRGEAGRLMGSRKVNRRRAHTSRWAGDDVIFHPREGLQEMPPIPPDLSKGGPLDSSLWPRIIG
jgi:hypothetical protein